MVRRWMNWTCLCFLNKISIMPIDDRFIKPKFIQKSLQRALHVGLGKIIGFTENIQHVVGHHKVPQSVLPWWSCAGHADSGTWVSYLGFTAITVQSSVAGKGEVKWCFIYGALLKQQELNTKCCTDHTGRPRPWILFYSGPLKWNKTPLKINMETYSF